MGNLGGYQAMTTYAKTVGGPKVLGAITLVGGYVLIRPAEAVAKKVRTEIKRRSEPCVSKGMVFAATAEGANGGVKLRVGDPYRVLECDGDAILIEVFGDSKNPYFVSSKFLSSISDYPLNGTSGAPRKGSGDTA